VNGEYSKLITPFGYFFHRVSEFLLYLIEYPFVFFFRKLFFEYLLSVIWLDLRIPVSVKEKGKLESRLTDVNSNRFGGFWLLSFSLSNYPFPLHLW
jgi:hypothetical protein